MTGYEDLREDGRRICSLIVDEILQPIAFEHFERDRGHSVSQVLPDRTEEYRFSSGEFKADIYPDRRSFRNPMYDDIGITVNRMISEPNKFEQIVEPLYDLWWDTFGEYKGRSAPPKHPGDPPIEKSALSEAISELSDQHKIVTADPLLEDLVGAVKDKNYRVAAQFLNLDVDPLTLFEPGGSHELTELFTNGDIHIIYKDRDIALLKPEYYHGVREEVRNPQRDGWGRVRLRGEQPELAFVVGLDDTPTGLFVHSVDGSRLDEDQSVTRDYIHDVMGFDYNYQHEDVLTCEVGDRVRLQGDLAVELLSENGVRDADRCNLPIDNHLCMLNHGKLPDGETKEEEPVEVDVPDFTALNIMHDEHDNVAVDLPEGRYRFYLLPRGLQQPEERPNW